MAFPRIISRQKETCTASKVANNWYFRQLSAKLGELVFMRASTGDEPVLLLDDVFSELDNLRHDYLLAQIVQHDQVFLTSTDLAGFPPEIMQRAHIYHVVNGMATAREVPL
jgi:DNA replication and repair protein RecF